MLLTGKKNLNLHYENNLNFIFDLIPISHPSGTGIFGFEDFNFKIINNKLLDPENIFIDTLESGKKIFLSGELSSTGYSYYLNDDLIALNKQKISNNINKFYYDFQEGFLNLNNLKFFGIFQDLQLSFPQEVNPGGLFTGYISNLSNKNININSGIINSPNNFELNILDTGVYLPNSSGKIIIQTSGFNKTIPIKNFPIEINLFGDFGEFNQTLLINRYSENFNYSIFSGSNLIKSNLNANFGENIIFDNILFYESISGRNQNNEIIYYPKNVELDLIYSGGYTGDTQSYILGSGITNINFSGEITGQGYLSKLITIEATGRNPTNDSNYINTLTQTGYSDLIIVSGFIENQKTTTVATGVKFGDFLVSNITPVILQEEKQIKLSNNILGFGILTGITSGMGYNNQYNISGTGFFYYNTGSYFTGNYIYNLNNINYTGIYEGDADCNYINTGYYSGQFSGIVTGAGEIYSNQITYNATGKISGDLNERIITKEVSNILNIPQIATGLVNVNISFKGFGDATGDYRNTNISGNIINYTGLINSNYTGFINGTGFLINSGEANLKNKYGEEKLTNYIDIVPYQAIGNVNNVNSPENIVYYNYSCSATGANLITGISGIIGYSTNDNIINLSGFIIESGYLTGKAENDLLKATGIISKAMGANFYLSPVTGHILDTGIYTTSKIFTGFCHFSGKYPVRLYADGFSPHDWQLEPGALSGWYNRNPGGGGPYDNIAAIPIPRPYLRRGYIETEIDLPLTGINFTEWEQGYALIRVEKPYKDFIYIGNDFIAFQVLHRDFGESPARNFAMGSKDGYDFLFPDNEITWLSHPSVARSYYRPNPLTISGNWNYEGNWNAYQDQHTYTYDWTLDPKSAFKITNCPPGTFQSSDCNTTKEAMLVGYITVYGSGMMHDTAIASGTTGILISGSGMDFIKTGINGTDFDYVTGYQKDISKLRTQNINGYEYSGWDTRTINRTGNFSINLSKSVTGLNYSQIEFTYTGLLTGSIENILINNSSGYLYTGVLLQKTKEQINLNNFKYINLDNQNYDLNLNPISNLSGSGFGLIPATGFFIKDYAGIFVKNNTLIDSGKFLVTGLNNNFNININYLENNSGVKSINNNYTGYIKDPNVVNSNFRINSNTIIGTGRFNQNITGSGYLEKLVNINNISGDISPGDKIIGNYLDVQNKNFYISGNAISGVIDYNNIVTGYDESGFLYSGYISKTPAIKKYNFNNNILMTGYLNDPLNYKINFENSYSIATGIYNKNTNNIEYKNLEFVNGKYHGTGTLPPDVAMLYITTKLKEYKNSNPIEAILSISGNATQPSGVININYKKLEVN
jgi:hypothetical protein